MGRITVRLVVKDDGGTLLSVMEHSIPADVHAVHLLLRREPFKTKVADALLLGHSATFECLKDLPR